MEQKTISVNDLKVVYKTDRGTAQAVNNISFSLEPQETFGIVGETGAGKTTTALSIMGLLPPRSGIIENGSIYFEGKDLVQFSEKEMMRVRGGKISMIFQDPMTSLNPVLTVEDQISEVIGLHHNKSKLEIAERVDEILNLVGIAPHRKKEYPYQFSGGMKQRVVIAIALACNPKLLIADEPTTALDVTIQAQVLEMIEDLKQKIDSAIIMITHDLGIVAQTCNKVGVMYAGEMIESGLVEDIYNPVDHHPYTMGLFGSIPNLTVKTKRLSPITGMAPDPMFLPQGCKFCPRCPHAMEVCKTTPPTPRSQGTHTICCHLYK